METEITIYRVAAIAFAIFLPVALLFTFLPARNVLRKRLRWGAVAFIGLGTAFVGLAASWPGPNSITLVMIFGGFIAFAVGTFSLTRSLCRSRT